jgi:exopolysaccharide biosynthesis polyprenyl glycosylphosphotransferase
MMKTQGALLLLLSALLDAAMVGGSFALIWTSADRRHDTGLILALVILPVWTRLLRHYGFYQSHRLQTLRELTWKILSVQTLGGSLLLLTVLALRSFAELTAVAAFLLLSTILLLFQKWAVYGFLHLIRQRGFDTRNVCVIGNPSAGERIAHLAASHPHWGLRVVCVGDGPAVARQFRRYPDLAFCARSLRDALSAEVIDEVVITCAPEDLPAERETIRICDDVGVLARVMLTGDVSERAEPRFEEFCGQVSMALAGQRRDEFLLVLKRATDLTLASVLLVVLSPLMILSAVLVKLSSRGPVIFSQLRVGLHGRRFRLLKFRTMFENAEAAVATLAHRSITGGPIFKDPHDLRVTPVGRILRRLSLDELPQLVNVLVGDMSLVGPRPLPLHESAAISGPHRRRFSMRPGLTCLWQVNGRSNVNYAQWMQYDLDYVDGWSLALDAKLLVKTIPAVVSGRGAY